MMAQRWKFWIDVGGTFTDCLAESPDGARLKTKVLNRQRAGAMPAPIVAIRELVGLSEKALLPDCDVRLGTTRGTNALLERKGARVAFVTTGGFGDLLLIGDQARPDLFALEIVKNHPLYETSIEIDERILHDGTVEKEPDDVVVGKQLEELKSQGIASIAISLMHGFRFPDHEQRVATIARQIGFADVRTSHKVAPLIKIVPRSETTVLDAYLNPVIGAYLDSIQDFLSPSSTLELMTSSGGLVGREDFSGKDSVLSGPAGGVVATTAIGNAFGFEQVIGFDMGGTSTDVSRYDARGQGAFERDYESVKANVRIMTPMLAIETVAAGGGSVCRFDGAKLVVGPQSAGATPGPACYGNGGPLTITDVNLLLGRICSSQFPFELDHDAARNRMDEVCQEIQAAGMELSREDAAAGFLEIANHNMASAIKSISVGKGYDPKQHAMVAFGGAASQHACAVANLLGIESVIDHRHASILSAVGIQAACPASHEVESVIELLDGIDQQKINAIVERVTFKAAARLGSDSDPETRTVLELRYEGTESGLGVVCDDADPARIAESFERAHRREFGYIKQVPIELMAVRVEASIRSRGQMSATRSESPVKVSSEQSQEMYFRSGSLDAMSFQRSELGFGDVVVGPAMVTSRFSTTIVDPGWQAEVVSDESLLLTPTGTEVRIESALDSSVVDPVQLEIFNRKFSSIASRMGLTLQKTSVSVNVKERLDFSCAIFTGEGDLVVNAPHIPVHLGAMSETVRQIIERNESITPGDVFVTNNPFAGGSHLPDVTVVTPVFVAQTKPTFWVASRGHHSEIGGKTPGSMPPDAIVLAEEGVLIDNFNLIDGGAVRWDELRSILESGPWPSRDPKQNIDDIAAQVAANRIGERELLALVGQSGSDVVTRYMKFIQNAAEHKTRNAIKVLPEGELRFEDALDNGATIRVALQRNRDSLLVDFTGTDPVIEGNQNANRAIVLSAVMYVMRLLIDDDIPLNEGVLNPVELVLPECFLNPAVPDNPLAGPAVVGGNVETSQRIVDVLLGALGVAAASQGTMNNWLMGDQNFGYYETLGGGSGATRKSAGASAVHVHMTNTRLTDPEILESRFPVVLRECSVREQSGGAGEHAGGQGLIREIEFCRSLSVSLLTNRRQRAPYGLCGGGTGSPGVNLLIRDGEACELAPRCQLEVEPGQRLRIETPGGGGFGAN